MLPPLFNPSNDMALAANVAAYTPPLQIQQMERELAPLCQYWDEGPWGWSLATRLHYRKIGINESCLPTDEWLENHRHLSSRKFACTYIYDMLAELKDECLVGGEMRFLRSLDPLSSSLNLKPLIFKSPWSSSGRGVFTSVGMLRQNIEERLRGYIRTQGGFLVDRFYDKQQDFAMEFMIGKNGKVDFIGYSVFEASTSGTYGFNYVESQEELRSRINVDESLLQDLIHYHCAHLGTIGYSGPVGIDMIVCRDGKVHPCIEINFRMNMGILAQLLHRRFGSGANIQLAGSPSHGFCASIVDGKMGLNYKK